MLVAAALFLFAAGFQRIPPPAGAPRFVLRLPPGITADHVQVHEFLTGPFGGAGGPIERIPGRNQIIITGAYEGRSGTHLKVVAFVLGCQFGTYDVALSPGSTVTRDFVCNPLPSLPLSGVISAKQLRAVSGNVHVIFEAAWTCHFFGISDCLIAPFNIGSIPLQPNRTFRGSIPDFLRDPAVQQTPSPPSLDFFSVALWDSHDDNIVGDLQPINNRPQDQDLKLAASYPQPMRFLLRPRP